MTQANEAETIAQRYTIMMKRFGISCLAYCLDLPNSVATGDTASVGEARASTQAYLMSKSNGRKWRRDTITLNYCRLCRS